LLLVVYGGTLIIVKELPECFAPLVMLDRVLTRTVSHALPQAPVLKQLLSSAGIRAGGLLVHNVPSVSALDHPNRGTAVGHDNRQAATHSFERCNAERLRSRREEEDIRAGVRTSKVGATQGAKVRRFGDKVRKALQRGPVANNRGFEENATALKLLHSFSEHVERLLPHEAAHKQEHGSCAANTKHGVAPALAAV